MNTVEKIKKLKEEKKAIILAHYYVDEEVQKIADYIGDSFYLAKVASQTDADRIVFAGVEFMGESAKILNPEKKVSFFKDTSYISFNPNKIQPINIYSFKLSILIKSGK